MINKYSTISFPSFFLLLFVPFLLYPSFIYIFSFTFFFSLQPSCSADRTITTKDQPSSAQSKLPNFHYCVLICIFTEITTSICTYVRMRVQMYVCQICKEIITNKIFSLIPLNMAFCDRSNRLAVFRPDLVLARCSRTISLSCRTILRSTRTVFSSILYVYFSTIFFFFAFRLTLSSVSSSFFVSLFLSLVLSYSHDIFPIHTIDC